jgi:predicted DNA-binding protein
MTRLSVRLTDEEERLLVRRARNAGMKKATFVRHLIREESFTTANEALVDAEQRMGDMHLRASRKL